jgi:nucleoside-diphosphate-sugar epimerase
VHAVTLPKSLPRPPEQIMNTNLMGTLNVLLVAEEAGIPVVFFSSVQALGVLEGIHVPRYLPLDDDYPGRPVLAYSLSKRFGEDLCASFTERTGLTTVCLRPVAVWDEPVYRSAWQRHRDRPDRERAQDWQLGAFVDVRDVASAVCLALEQPPGVHARLLLCADDISATRPTLEMLDSLDIEVDLRHADAYEADPWRALVDCSRAREVLGWRPLHTWAAWVAEALTDESDAAR